MSADLLTKKENMEVLDKPQSAVAEYQPFYAQLAELEASNTALVFDYESKKGNKDARSHVNSLRLTKGALERTRKSAKEESLRIGRAVDSEAKQIEARIEAMISVHQTEIDKIEQREKDRIAAIKVRLDALSEIHVGQSAKDYRFHIATLEAVSIDDSWQEFTADAARAKDASLAEHRRLLAEREKHDADVAELERHRAEAAARDQKDREEKIAREASERAAAAAELKAKQEREAADRRELELKLAAETAERRRVEAEQKAEQDKKDAAARAEAATLKAIKDEQERVAAIQRAEEQAAAKREANKAHKARINKAALAALIEGGLSEEAGKLCITLIASGKVPAVEIAY